MLLRFTALLVSLLACPSVVRGQIVITFDTLPAMGNAPGVTVPLANRLSNQLAATLGVEFSSAAPFVAVVNHGTPTPSVPNIIGGASAAGALSYSAPIHIRFVDPANPASPAVTSAVSVRGDLTAIPGTATMRAFGVDGTLLGAQTVNDVPGGLLLSLAIPGIHRIELTQTSATIGMDNLTFFPVTPCSGQQAYCTAGTTTNGCVPSISASGWPSAAASSGYTLQVQQVDGQRQGLIFYGVSGPLAAQWGLGSSFLCVKTPTQRMPVSNTGGAVGQCNGALSIDWRAWTSSNPGALGTPFGAGDMVYAQGWFRDPAASKATNLSNALSFALCP